MPRRREVFAPRAEPPGALEGECRAPGPREGRQLWELEGKVLGEASRGLKGRCLIRALEGKCLREGWMREEPGLGASRGGGFDGLRGGGWLQEGRGAIGLEGRSPRELGRGGAFQGSLREDAFRRTWPVGGCRGTRLREPPEAGQGKRLGLAALSGALEAGGSEPRRGGAWLGSGREEPRRRRERAPCPSGVRSRFGGANKRSASKG